MNTHRKLPQREAVFMASLLYHGFRFTRKRKNLKFRRGYVIPATGREDSGGVDFWVKMPRDSRLFPIQVTQRGVRMYREFHKPSSEQLAEFVKKAKNRVEAKRRLCKKHGVAFVLVRDYTGHETSHSVAWGDIKALKYAIAHLKRWL